MRVNNIKSLNLSQDLEIKITKQTYSDRMDWELWIESAENYTELKKSLSARDFTNLPLASSSLFQEDVKKLVDNIQNIKKTEIRLVNKPKDKSMLRKQD